jgi:hypothetical protein
LVLAFLREAGADLHRLCVGEDRLQIQSALRLPHSRNDGRDMLLISGDLTPLVAANALVRIPPNPGPLSRGVRLPFLTTS